MPRDAPYLTKVLGQQLDCSVYNVHRLDAKTSGVIVLALNPEVAHQLTNQFAAKSVEKIYVAIVKGIPGEGLFDRPVKKAKRGNKAPSRTHYRTLQTVNTQMEHKDDNPVHLSLVELRPETGRWHQLRQHCSQQRHDIIGDAQHGDWGLNHKLEEITGNKRLYLHAQQLTFTHPSTEERLSFKAAIPAPFPKLLDHFGNI
jgi:tRNA pseudouridine65 synthase